MGIGVVCVICRMCFKYVLWMCMSGVHVPNIAQTLVNWIVELLLVVSFVSHLTWVNCSFVHILLHYHQNSTVITLLVILNSSKYRQYLVVINYNSILIAGMYVKSKLLKSLIT